MPNQTQTRISWLLTYMYTMQALGTKLRTGAVRWKEHNNVLLLLQTLAIL